MMEISEYLSKLYTALRNEDTDTLGEMNGFVETDDQDDYEAKDLREIELAIAEYIENGTEQSRENAMILIDEFDVDIKYDEF